MAKAKAGSAASADCDGRGLRVVLHAFVAVHISLLYVPDLAGESERTGIHVLRTFSSGPARGKLNYTTNRPVEHTPVTSLIQLKHKEVLLTF